MQLAIRASPLRLALLLLLLLPRLPKFFLVSAKTITSESHTTALVLSESDKTIFKLSSRPFSVPPSASERFASVPLDPSSFDLLPSRPSFHLVVVRFRFAWPDTLPTLILQAPFPSVQTASFVLLYFDTQDLEQPCAHQARKQDLHIGNPLTRASHERLPMKTSTSK